MSGNESSGSGQDYTGLRGTPYQGAAASRANEAGEMANNWAKQVNAAPNKFMGQTGQELYGSGQYGLGFNVDPAIREYSKQMYSLASASGAARGRLTPEGAEAAAGDAITQSLPALIPQLMQFGQWQYQLPMNLNTYASNIFNQNAGTQNQALGASGEKSSESFGFGFLEGAGSGVGSAAGAAMFAGCWVAREVYGELNPKWLHFYSWLMEVAPQWFRSLYLMYGEKFAAWIENKPWLKSIIRKWMDTKVK